MTKLIQKSAQTSLLLEKQPGQLQPPLPELVSPPLCSLSPLLHSIVVLYLLACIPIRLICKSGK